MTSQGANQKRSNAAIRTDFRGFLKVEHLAIIAQEILCKALHSLVA
jgi:hypothetical protein